MRSIDTGDVSLEPTLLGALSLEQKERLADVLDRYLSSLDEAVPIDRAALLGEHPDLAEPLAAYLDRLDELHDAAAGFAGGDRDVSAEAAASVDGEKQIGDFKLVREIGRGGMGVVYEAWQVSLGRRVALKILPFAAVLDSKQIARFRNEAQAAAQLHHTNIVPVFAVGVERGVHFYAMQFIDGQPLDQAIDELRTATGNESDSGKKGMETSPSRASTVVLGAHSADTWRSDRASQGSLLKHDFAKRGSFHRTAVRLGIEAAEALHAAHEFGVVHRDVKPSNLLLDGEGKLWVTDFGLARIQSNPSLTRTGDLVGTMRYMSPEQATGNAALVDQRTDVYSLGTTLYELLALRHAFEGDDGPTLLRRIEQEEPRPLRQLAPRVPADLETVIHKAMAKSPSERYATAKDFADDLRRVLDGQPTMAKPPTVVDRLSKWARRHRSLVLSAAAVGLCAIIALSVGTALILREKAEADRNYQRADSYFHQARDEADFADANYRQARDAVNVLGLRMAHRLANEPGATHFRRELLDLAIGYYQEFIERAKGGRHANDPGVRVDMALAYENIGKLTEYFEGAAKALPSYRQSQQILEDLIAAPSEDSDHEKHRQWLATVLNNLGKACVSAGEFAEAHRSLDAAIDIRSELAARDSRDAQQSGDLAISLSNLGQLMLAEGKDAAAAEQMFRRALAIQRRLVEADPENGELLATVAATYNGLGAVCQGRDPVAALDCCRQAVDLMTRAYRAHPENIDYRAKLATMYRNLGAIEASSSDFAAGAKCYRSAIELLGPLQAEAADNKTLRCELAAIFNNQGLLQTRMRQPGEAQRSFDKALTLYTPVRELYPNDHLLASSVGGVYNNLGFLLSGLGQDEAATAAYESAIIHQKEAWNEAPQVSQYRQFLSKHYFNYGAVLRKLNRPQDAMRAALSRRELWPDDAGQLVSVAEELALAWRMMAEQPKLAAAAETCAGRVVSTLKEAGRDAILAEHIENNAAFVGLIDRPEFAEVLKNRK
ncbi:MAG: serine/threonine-protein kinase [Pirellulales bacterium]